jgi:DNA-binding SARP family transcriptional activator/tetratricopeptide (TPR) repeat protein
VAEFRILGPIEVVTGDGRLELGTAKQRAVLAALLVEAEVPVSAETLVDRIWDQDPPSQARRVLQAHLSRIRAMLAEVTRRGGEPVELQRSAGSYVLRVAPERVDLHRARRLIVQAREAGVDSPARAERLREAMGCWRGEPLAGLSGDWFTRVREGLVRQRLDVLAEWSDVMLRLGRPPVEVIDVLRASVADHPAVEPLVEQLMRALAAAGRSGEALEVFASTRTRLVDELGAGPGPRLQAVHQAILREESVTADAADDAATPPVPAGPHRQLPPDIAEFTGRSAEVATLLTDMATPRPTAPAVVAIVGMGGVGKSRLALHVAHRLVAAGHFDDGQLYTDLRGFAAGIGPAEPRDILAEQLRLLGVPPQAVPDSTAARSALLRDHLADRRVLIVLDNVADEAQAEPLLPGSPTCTVLLTSRRNLALDGGRAVHLDVFTDDEAVGLLTAVVGADRVAAEPDAARELVERCGRLPLAVAIAGHRLRARPTWRIEHLVGRLGDAGDALDELTVGTRQVHAVIAQSYRALAPAQQRVLRLLSLHPGTDWTAWSAAALTGTTLVDAEHLLEELLDQHLLDQHAAGRYHMHDLVRAFARRTCATVDPVKQRDEAVTRLLDWYLHAAEAASRLVRRFRPPVVAHFVASKTPMPQLATPEQAFEWFDAEIANLVAACHTGVDGPGHRHAMQLPHLLQPYFIKRSLIDQWLTAAQLGVAAAEALNNRSGQAYARTDLGHARGTAGQAERAVADLRRALEQHRELRDEYGEGLAHNHLATYLRRLGEHVEAAEHLTAALDLFRRCEDRTREVSTRSNLSVQYHILGRNEEAIEHGHAALALQQELGGGPAEASTRTNLGKMYARLGRYDDAIEHTLIALAFHRAVGSAPGTSKALATLAHSYAGTGRDGEALDAAREALDIGRHLGDRSVEVEALTTLADVHRFAGRTTQARVLYEQALGRAVEAGDEEGTARARDGLAAT